MNKAHWVTTNADELRNIETIFEELVDFLGASNDPQILQKIHDITAFLHKAFGDLDQVTKGQMVAKKEIFIDYSFKPLAFNVRKALEVVKKFEMAWPDQNGYD